MLIIIILVCFYLSVFGVVDSLELCTGSNPSFLHFRQRSIDHSLGQPVIANLISSSSRNGVTTHSSEISDEWGRFFKIYYNVERSLEHIFLRIDDIKGMRYASEENNGHSVNLLFQHRSDAFSAFNTISNILEEGRKVMLTSSMRHGLYTNFAGRLNKV